MKRFFISFSSLDSAIAQFLLKYLHDLFQGSATFFLSPYHIEPSVHWRDKLKSELKQADAGIFLLTENSIKADWVRIELGALWSHEKPIFPLVLGDLPVASLNAIFAEVEVCRITEQREAAALIRKLFAECGVAPPPPYNSEEFCESLWKVCPRSYKVKQVSSKRDEPSVTNVRTDKKSHDVLQQWLMSQAQQATASWLRRFERCYGEHFELWKLWNYSWDYIEGDRIAFRREMLQRIASCEGRMESLFFNMSNIRVLREIQKEAIAKFRQAFQQLRGRIRRDVALEWKDTRDPGYVALKSNGAAVYSLLLSPPERLPVANLARSQFLEITDQKWEGFWKEPLSSTMV